MEPDDILDALNETSTAAEVGTRQVVDAVRRAHAEGRLDLGGAGVDALPVFLLGVVGGAVGVRFLKGTLGLVVAAGAGYWAWTQLQAPPKSSAPRELPPQAQPSPRAPLKQPSVLRVPGARLQA